MLGVLASTLQPTQLQRVHNAPSETSFRPVVGVIPSPAVVESAARVDGLYRRVALADREQGLAVTVAALSLTSLHDVFTCNVRVEHDGQCVCVCMCVCVCVCGS